MAKAAVCAAPSASATRIAPTGADMPLTTGRLKRWPTSMAWLAVLISGGRLLSNTRTCTERVTVAVPSLALKLKVKARLSALALLTTSASGVHSKLPVAASKLTPAGVLAS